MRPKMQLSIKAAQRAASPIDFVFSNATPRIKNSTYPKQYKTLTRKLALSMRINKISPQPHFRSFAIIMNNPDSDVLKGV